jgi:hypothetical protein
MEKEDWPTRWEVWEMAALLRSLKEMSRRKLRLLASAFCRRFLEAFPFDCYRRAVFLNEQYAEGQATSEAMATVRKELSVANHQFGSRTNLPEVTLRAMWLAWDDLLSPRAPTQQLIAFTADAARTATFAAWNALGPLQAEASLVEIWRAAADFLRCVLGNPFRPAEVVPAWTAWNGRVVERMAQEIYEERELPLGTLDRTRLFVLTDALEEAGCVDESILGHLRGPTDHVRGCFVVDSILGRE